MKNEEQKLKNRKILFIIGGCIFVLAVLWISIFAAIELPKTGTLEIGIAPKDAKIMVGNNEYKNGTYKMLPGTYSLSIKRDGFQEIEGAIVIENGSVSGLKYCMTPNEGNEDYQWSEEEQNICFAASEYEESQVAKQEQSDEIFKYIPYRSYKDGYAISAEKADGENTIIVTITTMSCVDYRNKVLQKDAVEFLKSKNLDLDKYFIVYKSSCGGSD